MNLVRDGFTKGGKQRWRQSRSTGAGRGHGKRTVGYQELLPEVARKWLYAPVSR